LNEKRESKHIDDTEKEKHALKNMLRAHRKGPDGYEEIRERERRERERRDEREREERQGVYEGVCGAYLWWLW